MNKKILLVFPALLLLISCKKSLKQDELIGTWNYVKVHELNRRADSVTMAQVKEQQPSIIFYKSGELEMNWGGKLLSHGRYKLEGMNIQYTETLPDGNTRTFPFYVSELTDKQIVFETKDRDGARITAVKK